MKQIYQNALEKSMSYDEYLQLMDQMIAENRSTGHEQNDILTDFTKLNRTRIKRLDKTQTLLPEAIEAMQKISAKQIWLVLTESWCGDAAQNVPVLKKMADQNPLIELRMVLRDDNDDLMQKYLTNGGRSIPKLIAMTDDLEKELFSWGPRPKEGAELVINLKEQYGKITDEVKTALQLWYNKDKGVAVQHEIIELL